MWNSKGGPHDRQLADHIIICGHGRVGKAAIENLLDLGHQVVVIDSDVVHLEDAVVRFLVGDASDDEVLRAAGIDGLER